MRMRAWGLGIAFCSVLLACTVSEKAPTQILKPQGESVRIVLQDERKFSGELLSANGDGLVLIQENTILRLPLSVIESVKVEGYGSVSRTDLPRNLQPYCRYPNGLTDTQWRQVLDHHGQAETLVPPGL